MANEFTKELDNNLAAQILKNVSNGIALFNSTDFYMHWCNPTFKKQTWFGGAGKSAVKVNITDLFQKTEHKLIFDLINIALNLGQAYDFERMVRRGPIGSFPAEIKFHKITLPNSEVLVCIEITDLSLTKMYDDLQNTHALMREKMAELMTTQAELHYSIRMNTISEIGSDIAHQLINPITMCRGILETQVLPTLLTDLSKEDMHKALHYMQDIQDLAVWFRKFSNPKLSETQSAKIVDMVNDALMLNVHRFTTLGIIHKIRIDDNYNPSVLANPVNFIMWLNAAFAELSNAILKNNNCIFIDINGNENYVTISVHCLSMPGSKQKINISTLEKFAHKMPGNANFESMLQENHIHFSLGMNCLQEEFIKETEKAVKPDGTPDELEKGELSTSAVLIIDDEDDIRRLMKRSLKNCGLEIFEAADGLYALEYFQQEDKKEIANRIKVIVCDVRMPRMTGPHLLVALREENIQTPFIFFSSNLVDNGDNGFKYQNIYYLTKESGLDELKKLVCKFIDCKKHE